MLLPAVDPSTGPFQGIKMGWHGDEPAIGTGARGVALSYYLALMTQTCLELTGARGPVIVEGPFARNQEYLAMMQAATGRPVYHSEAQTGTSIGAALLFDTDRHVASHVPSLPPENFSELQSYAATWQSLVEAQTD